MATRLQRPVQNGEHDFQGAWARCRWFRRTCENKCSKTFFLKHRLQTPQKPHLCQEIKGSPHLAAVATVLPTAAVRSVSRCLTWSFTNVLPMFYHLLLGSGPGKKCTKLFQALQDKCNSAVDHDLPSGKLAMLWARNVFPGLSIPFPPSRN